MKLARLGVMVGVLAVWLIAAVVGHAERKAPRSHHLTFAQLLRDRDPGKRVGGNTIVMTGNGNRAVGVPDRPDFIVALGKGDTIVGSGRGDQIGALGHDDTIVAGRSGHELLVAGPGGKLVADGAGHDLVEVTKPDATINLRSPDDEVIDSGHDDHIVCSSGSFHDVIHDNQTDTVSKACRRHHDPVHAESQRTFARDTSRPTAHVASVLHGSGTNADQYTAPCTDEFSYYTQCLVKFPARTLTGFWANEYVPAYRCPTKADFPDLPYSITWLNPVSYAPSGTKLPLGVEVTGLGPIGVSLSHTSWIDLYTPFYRQEANGTLTGFGYSSATNWAGGTQSYQVILHCWTVADRSL